MIVQGRAGSLCNFNVDLADNPPQIVLTYTPPAIAAFCLDASTGTVNWSIAAQALGSPFLVLGKSLFSPDGAGIFVGEPPATFGTGGALLKLDPAAGATDWLGVVPGSATNSLGDFTFLPTGELYANTWGVSTNVGGIYSVDPALGGWTFLGGATEYPVAHLTAFEDGSWGSTDSTGNYVRFTAGSVSTDPLSKMWAFAKQGFEGYVGAATDGTHAFLVNGGKVVRVNPEGTADYAYTVPLVPPLVASVSVAPAAFVVLDKNGNVYVGGSYVQFEAPG